MREDLMRWQAQRHAELSGPDSWLGMQGLFWLEPGVNQVGSGEHCGVRLPSGPDHLGDLIRDGERVYWQPLGDSARELQTDRFGSPATVDHENLAFFIVDREGRLAARVRDRNWAARQPFAGLSYFPAAAEWAIEAEWQVLTTPLAMEVPNVTGELKTVLVSHKAVFSVAGQRIELLPMSVGEHEVFFVFRDRTSGKETYGAGRFLKVSPAVDGKIRLDFNHAYNPPCAFTPFATCPLPPPENWLPFAVPAGEMKPRA
ncbi:DUF1684 domain-containing protein [Quatrionicoccus australiensis]|uniref:DUF1684 domain-containing protein n=1 Tax=Quatrionicoccus australiensis TaxID=138118 RepID=UPI001CF8D976|nr:DUF1684 domain-containing protein [Quatrionicoccus australiensis]UCV13493.1 DUF1684 domain-containing protein [Quatrionicoccus australiensis]